MNYLESLNKKLKIKKEDIHDIPIIVNTSDVKKKKVSKFNIVKKTNITEDKDKEEQSTNITADKGKQPTNITANKDKGELSINILEKFKKQKMSRFAKTPLKEENPQPLSQAPIIEENMKKKLKKIDENIIILEEDEKIPEELSLPEGGPRLEEMMPVEKDVELLIKGTPNQLIQGTTEPFIEANDEEMVIIPRKKKVTRKNLIEEAKEEVKEEAKEEIIEVKPKKKGTRKRVTRGVMTFGPKLMINIGDTSLKKRLPATPNFDVKVSSYYMNNREIFVNFINNLFEPYREELLDETKGISCEDIGKDTGEIGLLTHQKIIKDYMNLYTPYRGLLLYHGLGAGKTCGSIAIAEAMKSVKQVLIMTPASLRRNYLEEIKKCGDLLYRKNQFWEWVSIDNNQTLIDPLSGSLGLPREFIRRKHGAWLTNVTKSTNYKELSASDKKSLNEQLDIMIGNKYSFINFNGIRHDKLKEITNNFENNIFDNKVVIIDEAHNLISRIVNNINKKPKFSEKIRGPGSLTPDTIALLLYEFLLNANNCRIVLLTGTPIINYPNEIGILFNILRGYIKTWSFTLKTETTKKLSKDTLEEIFKNEKVLDYFDYVPSSYTLTVTRNPFGFENKIKATGYKGVTNEKKEKRDKFGKIQEDSEGHILYDERGQISDADFIKRTVQILKKNDIGCVMNGTTYSVHTALPDTLEEFINIFINKDTGNITNVDKLKRRIMGLTSYFRSAQEGLMPNYDRNVDRHEVKIQMSDYQFKVYEDYRRKERQTESMSNKKGIMDINGTFKEPSSTYRIFSRLACNYAMPTPPGRPQPKEYRMLEQKMKADQWLEKKYLSNKDKYDEELNKKLYELGQETLAKDITDAGKEVFLDMVKSYTEEYLKKDLTEMSIKEYMKERGYSRYFDDHQPTKKEIMYLNIKSQKKVGENEDKDAKADAKADTKADAKKQKEAIKRAKEEAKEEAKEREKEAKETAKRAKEEAKERNKEAKERDKEAKERERQQKKDAEKAEKAEKKKEEKAEKERRKLEKKGGGNSDDEDDEDIDEVNIEDINIDEEEIEEEQEGDELLAKMGNVDYQEAIKTSMEYLKLRSQEYLSLEGLKTYGPKFLAMIENIENPEHKGLHLVYSQFRSMEGIGIFSLALEANGFAKFKIKQNGIDGWDIDMSEEDMGKPCYAHYTGTEGSEEREIIRNIYNGMWDYIPNNIATQLRAKSSNNNLGEIIKVLMITSAGSEGINLRNTRYVHIMEPYWHPVRTEQVIGRARRICSHQSLPKELQTVEVFIYIMIFTQQQLNSEYAIELKLKDQSKFVPYLPLSSDEKLFETSNTKEQLSSQILKCIKEASIDCATHIQSSTKEGLVCLSFGQSDSNNFSYNPNYSQDQNDTIAALNVEKIDWQGRAFDWEDGKSYVLRLDTNQVYDYDSVIQAKNIPGVKPLLLGKMIKLGPNKWEFIRDTY